LTTPRPARLPATRRTQHTRPPPRGEVRGDGRTSGTPGADPCLADPRRDLPDLVAVAVVGPVGVRAGALIGGAVGRGPGVGGPLVSAAVTVDRRAIGPDDEPHVTDALTVGVPRRLVAREVV